MSKHYITCPFCNTQMSKTVAIMEFTADELQYRLDFLQDLEDKKWQNALDMLAELRATAKEDSNE